MKFARFTMGAVVLGFVGLTVFGVRPDAGLAQDREPAAPNRRAGNNGFPEGNRIVFQTELQQNLPQNEANIDHQVVGLQGEYSRVQDEAQRGKIKAKLSEALEKQFDLQQKRRDLEMKQID